jgi:hypothetical protein
VLPAHVRAQQAARRTPTRVGAPVLAVPDRASSIEPRQDGGSGHGPGLSANDPLKSAQRTLFDAQERIAALLDEREVIDREVATWREIARQSHALVEHYRNRGLQSPVERSSPAAAPGKRGTPERFGPLVTPIADRLIKARGGPVPVEDIYAALSSKLRTDLDAGSDVYSTPFRLRRMFRRNKKYIVSDAGIGFASDQRANEAMEVTRLVRRDDGTLAAFEVRAKGDITYIRPAALKKALQTGVRVTLPDVSGRRSTLRLAGSRFYAESDSVENSDFFSVPEMPVRELPDSVAVDNA